jgi:hypothetical protein
MKTSILTVATALAFGVLAGCDRPSNQPAGAGASAPPQSNTPTTPANIGQPQSQAEKREGANPTQGQVDPKQAEQHRDFQHKGDSAGPTSPDTQPKTGG